MAPSNPGDPPPDCLDLIHSRDSFVFDGWEKSWFNAQLFRVSGLTDALSPIGVRRDQIQFFNLAAAKTRQLVPAQWIEFFDPARGAHGAWTQLGKPQIERHIQKGFPQVFDRALMSVLYTKVYVEEYMHKPVPKDFFDKVRIIPAPYAVEVDGPNVWNRVSSDPVLMKQLEAVLGPCPLQVAEDALAQNMRLTYRNAEVISKTLLDAGYRARIRCTRSAKPHAAASEVLDISRTVEHPSVLVYMDQAA